MADGDDVVSDGRWMTYRELAQARGIKRAAAIRLAQRHKWPKRAGSNDGLAHILVPTAYLSSPDIIYDDADNDAQRQSEPEAISSHTTSPHDNELVLSVTRQFEAALQTLHEQLDRAEARNSRQEAELTALREAVQRAERALDSYYRARGRAKGQGALGQAQGRVAGGVKRRDGGSPPAARAATAGRSRAGREGALGEAQGRVAEQSP